MASLLSENTIVFRHVVKARKATWHKYKRELLGDLLMWSTVDSLQISFHEDFMKTNWKQVPMNVTTNILPSLSLYYTD